MESDTAQGLPEAKVTPVVRQLHVLHQILRSLNSARIRKRSHYHDTQTLREIMVTIESLAMFVEEHLDRNTDEWRNYEVTMQELREVLQSYASPKKKDSSSRSKRTKPSSVTPSPSIAAVPVSEGSSRFVPGDEEFLVASHLASFARDSHNINAAASHVEGSPVMYVAPQAMYYPQPMHVVKVDSVIVPDLSYTQHGYPEDCLEYAHNAPMSSIQDVGDYKQGDGYLLPQEDSGGSSSWTSTLASGLVGDGVQQYGVSYYQDSPAASSSTITGFNHSNDFSAFHPFSRTNDNVVPPKSTSFWSLDE